MIQIFRRVGPDTDHGIEAVQKLDVALGKRALDLLESRCNIVGKGRGRQIDDEFLAEVERSSL